MKNMRVAFNIREFDRRDEKRHCAGLSTLPGALLGVIFSAALIITRVLARSLHSSDQSVAGRGSEQRI